MKLKLATILPIASWLPKYQKGFLKWDLIAGITLASFVLPESMAYATLAGVPSYYGIYCCITAGLLFALFTTSKHVAVGPTSSISLLVGSTVAVLSGGDPDRWVGIAALAALAVACICLIAYVLKLSSLVNFISDSILLGFKAGAALSIMSTQLPKLFAVEGGGAHFFSRMGNLFQQLPNTNWLVLGFGLAALLVLIAGDIFLPGKPISLLVVILSIIIISVTDLASSGFHITGNIPSDLPAIKRPSLRLRDIDGILELAFACFLLGYIETVSAARTFALKNNYVVNPRQELLSLGAANLATSFTSGYVVAGGLSQSTVNEKSGARTPLSLIICSVALSLILLYLSGLLKNLPEVILAVIVLHAVSGLIKIKELKRIYKLDKTDFAVAMIAIAGVLVLGILKGVMLAVVMSLILLIRRASRPTVSVLGRIGKSQLYSDVSRHPGNTLYDGILILRIESAIFYFNTEDILEKINRNIGAIGKVPKMVILDMSASPSVDVSGAGMLVQLGEQLQKKGIKFYIVEALSNVREMLRKCGIADFAGPITRKLAINDVVEEFNAAKL
ncbi:MAG TPA: SulP family inorganic anion transporter [Chitinophagaceae bacterium]|nr:SulP family inorganic anion transporter [Chitinophagaceae bacterium]